MADKTYDTYRRYGHILYWIVRGLSATIRWKVEDRSGLADHENAVYVVWHQKLFFPTVASRIKGRKLALVSPSRDGELMATVLGHFGYETIRGSSNDGNIRSLVRMIRGLGQGCNLGMAADGPQGPVFQVKPGIVFMASRTGKPIVPVGGAFARKYIFEKAWDRFQFPFPFTRAVMVVGEPIHVPPAADPHVWSERVNRALDQANRRAETLL